MSPLDLHVLGTPPAFVLSQDQTLLFNPLYLASLLSRSAALDLSPESAVSSLRFGFCIVFKVHPLSLTSQLAYNITLRFLCQAVF